MVSMAFVLLAVQLQANRLELLLVALPPCVSFSWGLLRHMSSVYFGLLLAIACFLRYRHFKPAEMLLFVALCVVLAQL